jgi:cytochrome c oxidase subunit 2
MQQFQQSGCVGCHVVNGVSELPGTIGPNLTHVGSRSTIASGTLPNTTEDLATWLRNPPEVKPGSLMPNLSLSDEQIQRLTVYLQSLQ